MTRSTLPPGMVPEPSGDPVVVPTTEQRNAFLEAVASGDSMRVAARRIGVSFFSFSKLVLDDPVFANDMVIARQMRNLAAEEILFEQSTVGIDEVLVHQGAIQYEYPNGYELDDSGNAKPGTVRVPVTVKKLVTSNPSLLAILKANFPEKYRERSEVNVNNAPGKRTHDVVPDRITNTDDRAKMLAFLEKRAAARRKPDPDEDLL